MFGCARHKLMTHYVHTGTVRDRVARQASRYDRENEAVLCWHTYINAFGRRQYLPDVKDYLPVQSITVCGKKIYLISADRPQKVRQWRDVKGLPMCNGLDAISSGRVSTGTGFRSVAKPNLHSAMLVIKRTNKHCWDCYVLERDRFGGGSFVVWGWKNGWPEDVLCYHARLGIKTKQKIIECNVFFCAKFPESVDILSWKETNAMCRFMVQCFLVESNSLLLKNGSFFLLFFLSASQMIYTRKI